MSPPDAQVPTSRKELVLERAISKATYFAKINSIIATFYLTDNLSP